MHRGLQLLLIGAAGLLVACSPRSGPPHATGPVEHDIRGEIVGIAVERRTLLVHHEAIAGFMPEMTMEFVVRDADPAFFSAGQRITARMIDEGGGTYRLEGIRVLDPAKDALVDAVTRRLREDTQRALRFGFGAKLCIHPRQVAGVHEAMAPSAEELDWARRVVAADAASGGAAVQLEGRMVDAPVVLRAQRLLARAQRR